MRWGFALVLVAALGALPTAARADAFDPISFGVSASTLGYGVTLERPLLFDLSARIATGWLQTSSQQSYGGGQWVSTLHESNVLVAMDWRPYGGRWRLSGGLLFGSDHVDKVAQMQNGSYTLNGNLYPAAGSNVTGTVSFAHPAPYVAIGAGTGIVKGVTLAFEAGFVLRNGSTTTTISGPLAANPQAQLDASTTAAAFNTRFLQPVLSLGLLVRP